MKEYNTMTVGQIVADNFAHASVFERYGIDFCCNGNVPLDEACRKSGVGIDVVMTELKQQTSEVVETIDFQSWPTDLLVDYILKFHHRRARSEGKVISELIEKVCRAHGEHYPELFEIRELLYDSMIDLENHLCKEEQILFPYIYELCEADAEGTKLPPFHCGSIESPIAVMMAEHDVEGERYREINLLTNGYKTPEDGCTSYRLLMERLQKFEAALHHHIHLENNIVFPRALQMEKRDVIR